MLRGKRSQDDVGDVGRHDGCSFRAREGPARSGDLSGHAADQMKPDALRKNGERGAYRINGAELTGRGTVLNNPGYRADERALLRDQLARDTVVMQHPAHQESWCRRLLGGLREDRFDALSETSAGREGQRRNGLHALGDRADVPHQHFEPQSFLGAEVVRDRAQIGAGSACDRSHGSTLKTLLGEELRGGIDKPVAGRVALIHTFV